MEHRTLGKTGLSLPVLSFGASSLGQEFRSVDINEALRAVRVALDLGMNFIDTSPYYGRGMSEVLLGVALRGVPRDQYMLGTKLGRYDAAHFDFSAKRVVESVDVSLHRMGVDHLDICLCHDIEFVDMAQIVEETLPALRRVQQQGKVRFVGISGYPMKIFRYVLDRTALDVMLSYNQYTLQNRKLLTIVPYLQVQRGRHHQRRALCRPAADQRPAAEVAQGLGGRSKMPAARRGRAVRGARRGHRRSWPCSSRFAIRDMTTCVVGSANPENVRKWAAWAAEPIDEQLLAEVEQMLAPVMDQGHIEGRPENN